LFATGVTVQFVDFGFDAFAYTLLDAVEAQDEWFVVQ
jgi:hypothetical protein